MDKNIFQFITDFERQYTDKNVFCFYEGETEKVAAVSFRQYAQDIRRFAAYLRATVPDVKGKHVAILSRNNYHYMVAWLGVMLADAVVIPMNIEENWHSVRDQLALIEPCMIVHDGEYAENEPELVTLYQPVMHNIHEFENCNEQYEGTRDADPEEISMMLFTSGTTSASKAVLLRWRNLYTIAWSFTEYYDFIQKREKLEEIKLFSCLPMYHLFGLSMLIAGMYDGCEMALCCNMKYFIRDLTTLGCNCSAMVPIMMEMLSKYLKRGQGKKLENIKDIVTAGAPCSQDIADLFEEKGIHITRHYGMSENSNTTLNDSMDRSKVLSVGKGLGDCIVKIVNGEVVVKSGSTMVGYYKNPVMTAETLEDGWVHTGDLGYLDEDGYLYLTGKKKNLIILASGENVSPEELEAFLAKNPDIIEAIAKEKQGKICAEVYCEPDKQEAIAEYIAEVNKQIALYKRMTLVEFRTEPFPRTGTGKIKRTNT